MSVARPPEPQRCPNCGHMTAATVCNICKEPMPSRADRHVFLASVVAMAVVAALLAGGYA